MLDMCEEDRNSELTRVKIKVVTVQGCGNDNCW